MIDALKEYLARQILRERRAMDSAKDRFLIARTSGVLQGLMMAQQEIERLEQGQPHECPVCGQTWVGKARFRHGVCSKPCLVKFTTPTEPDECDNCRHLDGCPADYLAQQGGWCSYYERVKQL